MISVSNFILAIIAQNTEAAPTADVMVTLPAACGAIDVIILSLAILITLRLFVQLSRPAEPTAAWLERPNNIKEDVVLWLLLVFFILQTGLASIFDTLRSDPENLSANALFGFITGSGAQLMAAVVCLILASTRFVGGVSAFLFGPPPAQLYSDLPEPRVEYKPDLLGARAELQEEFGIRSNVNRPGKLSITCMVLVLALGLCPLVVEITILLMQTLNLEFALDEHPTLSALQSGALSTALVVSLWIGAAVIAPLAEEFFFRGFVQTFLVTALGSPTKAIFVTAGVFASIHFPQPQAVPALFLLAVLLGYAYEKTGSIMVPVIIHACFNLKTLIWDSLATVT